MTRRRNGQRAPYRLLVPCVLLCTGAFSGCAVVGATAGAAIAVTGAVVSTGVSLTGKAIGAGIDAVSGPSEPDRSGIVVRERIGPASAAAPSARPCPPPNAESSPAPCP